MSRKGTRKLIVAAVQIMVGQRERVAHQQTQEVGLVVVQRLAAAGLMKR